MYTFCLLALETCRVCVYLLYLLLYRPPSKRLKGGVKGERWMAVLNRPREEMKTTREGACSREGWHGRQNDVTERLKSGFKRVISVLRSWRSRKEAVGVDDNSTTKFVEGHDEIRGGSPMATGENLAGFIWWSFILDHYRTACWYV